MQPRMALVPHAFDRLTLGRNARRITVLVTLLLCACVQPPKPPQQKPPQPRQRQEGTAQTQAIPPSQVASLPLAGQAPTPPVEPTAQPGQSAYAATIRAMVRRNLVLPRNVPQSASAVMEIVLSDTGAIARLTTLASSGFPAYDAAVTRAIQRAQPYPVLRVPGQKGPLTIHLLFQVTE